MIPRRHDPIVRSDVASAGWSKEAAAERQRERRCVITMLLYAAAALDGRSEAVHGLPRAADPLAHREDRAPEGPHASCSPCTPALSEACLGDWGWGEEGLTAGRRECRWGLAV